MEATGISFGPKMEKCCTQAFGEDVACDWYDACNSSSRASSQEDANINTAYTKKNIPSKIQKKTVMTKSANEASSVSSASSMAFTDPSSCFVEYADCTNESNCCKGYTCTQVDMAGDKRCLSACTKVAKSSKSKSGKSVTTTTSTTTTSTTPATTTTTTTTTAVSLICMIYACI